MNALELLLTRQSSPALIAPAPTNDELHTILTAGMRVPDHAALKPYHFTVVTDAGLQRLSDIFVQAVKQHSNDEAKLEKTARMPFRAPLMIIVSTRYQDHEKVPHHEQLITAGCSVHAMQMAAFALGYGAIWRTGELSEDPLVKQQLAMDARDDIAGFLYIGTPLRSLPIKPSQLLNDHLSYL